MNVFYKNINICLTKCIFVWSGRLMDIPSTYRYSLSFLFHLTPVVGDYINTTKTTFLDFKC